jgi:hypothetical protein
MLDQLDIQSAFLLSTLVALGQLSPDPGHGFGLIQGIDLGRPVHVAAPSIVDRLVGQIQRVVTTPPKGVKDDVHSPAYVRLKFYREAKLGKSILGVTNHNHDYPFRSSPDLKSVVLKVGRYRAGLMLGLLD